LVLRAAFVEQDTSKRPFSDTRSRQNPSELSGCLVAIAAGRIHSDLVPLIYKYQFFRHSPPWTNASSAILFQTTLRGPLHSSLSAAFLVMPSPWTASTERKLLLCIIDHKATFMLQQVAQGMGPHFLCGSVSVRPHLVLSFYLLSTYNCRCFFDSLAVFPLSHSSCSPSLTLQLERCYRFASSTIEYIVNHAIPMERCSGTSDAPACHLLGQLEAVGRHMDKSRLPAGRRLDRISREVWLPKTLPLAR
jgi:hypothetical protein